jgi:hypothetical protein
MAGLHPLHMRVSKRQQARQVSQNMGAPDDRAKIDKTVLKRGGEAHDIDGEVATTRPL